MYQSHIQAYIQVPYNGLGFRVSTRNTHETRDHDISKYLGFFGTFSKLIPQGPDGNHVGGISGCVGMYRAWGLRCHIPPPPNKKRQPMQVCVCTRYCIVGKGT